MDAADIGIGLCYGRPGVGKTLSARRCSRWDYFDNINPYTMPDEALSALIGVISSDCALNYTL
jgi:hypothetical protein